MTDLQYTIPEDSYNALDLIKERLESLRDSNYWQIQIDRSREQLSNFKSRIKKVRKRIGVKGDVLYYLCGGVDPTTPFSLSEDITDVFSQGDDPFGHIDCINDSLFTALNVNNLYLYSCFDNTDDLRSESTERGYLGQYAVMRIEGNLEGKLDGLYYFDIGPDGSFIFFKNHEDLKNKSYTPNAVIEFDMQDTKKRFWYIHLGVSCYGCPKSLSNPHYMEFISNLRFDTLLIKAAGGGWWDAKEECIHPEIVLDIAFDPARRNNALVIADSNELPLHDGEDIRIRNRIRPIWKKGYNPKIINMGTLLMSKSKKNELTRFGYGSVIYIGEARYLLNKDDPAMANVIKKSRSMIEEV